MFENLSTKITSAMRTLKGNGRITDVNVAATVKEIRRALMDADVNYKVAKEITDRIKEQALGQKILISVEPGQLLVKIVHEELTQLMGGIKQDINLKKLNVIKFKMIELSFKFKQLHLNVLVK